MNSTATGTTASIQVTCRDNSSTSLRARSSRSGLRLVHRGVRHARSERCQGATRRVSSMSAYCPRPSFSSQSAIGCSVGDLGVEALTGTTLISASKSRLRMIYARGETEAGRQSATGHLAAPDNRYHAGAHARLCRRAVCRWPLGPGELRRLACPHTTLGKGWQLRRCRICCRPKPARQLPYQLGDVRPLPHRDRPNRDLQRRRSVSRWRHARWLLSSRLLCKQEFNFRP